MATCARSPRIVIHVSIMVVDGVRGKSMKGRPGAVCLYVCVYVHICIYMYMYSMKGYVYVYMYMYICICICVYVYIYTNTYIHIERYLHGGQRVGGIVRRLYIHIYTYIYVYTHIYIGTCMEGNVWGALCGDCGTNCSCSW